MRFFFKAIVMCEPYQNEEFEVEEIRWKEGMFAEITLDGGLTFFEEDFGKIELYLVVETNNVQNRYLLSIRGDVVRQNIEHMR